MVVVVVSRRLATEPHQCGARNPVSLYADLEQFVQAHRSCGELTYWTSEPTPQGYQVRVACPCGVILERWVLPQDARRTC